MKVLFCAPDDVMPRGQMEVEMEAVPREGEHVALLMRPTDSRSEHFIVTDVWWTPDHTAWAVHVALEHLADS